MRRRSAVGPRIEEQGGARVHQRPFIELLELQEARVARVQALPEHRHESMVGPDRRCHRRYWSVYQVSDRG